MLTLKLLKCARIKPFAEERINMSHCSIITHMIPFFDLKRTAEEWRLSLLLSSSCLCRLLNNKIIFHAILGSWFPEEESTGESFYSPLALSISGDTEVVVDLQVSYAPKNALPQQLKIQFEWEDDDGGRGGESGCQIFTVVEYSPVLFEENLLHPPNAMN